MAKDFKRWHGVKAGIDGQSERVFFHEREVWWCSVGENVGFEQDGKGIAFSRPVLVLTKFNKEIFWALPLSTKVKTNKFYAPVTLGDGIVRAAILSQLRLIDAKRLKNKIGVVKTEEFETIKKGVTRLIG